MRDAAALLNCLARYRAFSRLCHAVPARKQNIDRVRFFSTRSGSRSAATLLPCFRGDRLMIVADFFDFTIHDLHHFRPDCLDARLSRFRPRKIRLRHTPAAIAGAYAQLTMGIRKEREFGLV